MKTLMLLIKPLASLKLTVVLLSMAMFLIFAGTLAQVQDGIMTVTNEYFRSKFVMIPLGIFVPDGMEQGLGISEFLSWRILPFPGAYLISAGLVINLIAAHIVRFKTTWKRIGIISLHLGLIILLGGEVITGEFQKEGYVQLGLNETRNFYESYEEVELAIIDASNPDENEVTIIPQGLLKAGKTISDPRLPIEITIDDWYQNSVVIFKDAIGPMIRDREQLLQLPSFEADNMTMLIRKEEKTSVIHDPDDLDTPAALVSVKKEGQLIDRFALTSSFSVMQNFEVDGKEWMIVLRPKRTYLDYTMTLTNLKHEIFVGTDIPKNFQSDILLENLKTGEKRDNVQIYMNHPLRYSGETFYQKQMNSVTGDTVLLVVNNPGWLIPYISCTIITLGMVIHFSISLVGFLRRHSKQNTKAVQSAPHTTASDVAAVNSKEGMTSGLAMKKTPLQWIQYGVMALVITLGLVIVGYHSAKSVQPVKASTQGFDYEAFGRIPVSAGGRIKPLDTVARNKLIQISNHTNIRSRQGVEMPAIEWLTHVLTQTDIARQQKVFKIELPVLVQELELTPDQKYFSWEELEPKEGLITQHAQRARSIPRKNHSQFQSEVLKLFDRISIFKSIFTMTSPYMIPPDSNQGEDWKQMGADLDQTQNYPLLTVEDPELLAFFGKPTDQPSKFSWADIDQNRRAILEQLQAASLKKFDELTPFEMALTKIFIFHRDYSANSGIVRLAVLNNANYPMSADKTKLVSMLSYHRAKDSDKFNHVVDEYLASLKDRPVTSSFKIDFEVFKNKFAPDSTALYFYIVIMLMTLISFLIRELSPGWSKSLGRAAFGLLLIALVIHTFGLGARIYIQGRPPITNLYSASIFVGWGVVLFAAMVEYFNRLGFATCAASIVGIVTTIVAINLAESGDTMQMMQAVLDSNFWLATHVIIVTLGYVATVLAGTIGMLYILTGFLTPWLTKTLEQKITRMVYGVTCFGMLFSFVGTVLGGIWADQSWGRFWGWDPKENGAAMVVLIAAIILHARWGGIVKSRGIMVLAVFGNIIVAWAFFGVNLLSIGFHSYGFTDSGVFWMLVFCCSMLTIMGVGMTPKSIWMSTTIQQQIAEREKQKLVNSQSSMNKSD